MSAPSYVQRRQALEEIVRRRSRRSIKFLTHYLWPILEPARPLEWGRHHDVIARHLEALWHGDLGTNSRRMRRLLLAVPPGSLKTTLVQIIFPLWTWLQDPTQRFLAITLTASLAEKSARKRLNILHSQMWADLIPGFELDKDTYVEVSNTSTGFIQSSTPGTKVTGQHADWYLIDDPQPASPTQREVSAVTTWYTDVLSSRSTDLRTLREVHVHQRVHALDLIGSIIEEGLLPGDAYVALQAEFDPTPAIPTETAWGQVDWRSIPGESIHPERLPDHVIAALKKKPRKWSTQYQQSPIVGHGEHIDDRWWRYYDELPAVIDWWIGAWDTAETTKETSDWTVGQVFAISGSDVYLVDQVRGRWSVLGVVDQVRRFRDKHPDCSRWYVEMASSGRTVLEMLSKSGGRLIGERHHQSKESRVYAASGLIEARQVHLPNPNVNLWVRELVAEASAFPNGAHDDQIDCMATALRRIMRRIGIAEPDALEGESPTPRATKPRSRPKTSQRRAPRASR